MATQTENGKVSFETFFQFKENENGEAVKTIEPNPLITFFEIKEQNETKDPIEIENASNPEVIKKMITLVQSIKTSFTEEISKNSEIQNQLVALIRGVDKPSVDLITFFKKYNYEIQPLFKSTIEREVESLLADLKDEAYKKNLKRICKNKDQKLEIEYKRLKSLLNEEFLEKVKTLNGITLQDQMHVSRVLGTVSSFVSDVKYYTPKVAITAEVK